MWDNKLAQLATRKGLGVARRRDAALHLSSNHRVGALTAAGLDMSTFSLLGAWYAGAPTMAEHNRFCSSICIFFIIIFIF